MKRYVYGFGGGKADGDGTMKDTLGGKGAGLAEMSLAGVPVPPGFTIATQVCNLYFNSGNKTPSDVEKQMNRKLAELERKMGKKLGDAKNPLLVSVRSGAKFSMPGMMDTILNLGLNDKTVSGLVQNSGNARFSYDCYRRFIQMFGAVVLELEKDDFEHILESIKKKKRAKLDSDLTADDLDQVVTEFKKFVKQKTGKPFPQDPRAQLRGARDAVFRSWHNQRAAFYRRMNDIPDGLGTAVNVQAMVFGNLGDTSATGVGFTRNPATGSKEFYGEFLVNAQGEDVVAGIRTPRPISELKGILPEAYKQLHRITKNLEKHYRDIQDFEFTIQDSKLFMLQTRNGKRTGPAAVKIAVDMVKERLISKKEAVMRVEPQQLDQLLHPVLEPDAKKLLVTLAKGLPASPGAAVGRVVFLADDAVTEAPNGPVILVRGETTPDDIHGMEVAKGILTARGGMTSHAAVVARGMGTPCVAGAGDLVVNSVKKQIKVGRVTLREGDWISLDGSTGEVFIGQANTIEPDTSSGHLAQFMKWVDQFRSIRVLTNAEVPRDAKVARQFGAEGIGLCRTEHMFFEGDRIEHMRAMILADSEKDRRQALKKLLPMQRKDFAALFKVMNGYPVIIRTLDPPLHEFLPKREELMVEIAQLKALNKKKQHVKKLEGILSRVEELHEFNPMLGHRGCRLGITFPEITEMQAQAIFEAAVQCTKKGIKVIPEIMIPLVGNVKELEHQKKIIVETAKKVFAAKGKKVKYMVGTMIEVPRGALTADQVANQAEFFSFGTNDLTQTTFGFSRDDAGGFIEQYKERRIFENDPFAVLDTGGVGQLIEIAVEKGRKTRVDLEVGICGEHGGDPKSVEFCVHTGLDYVSASPYRIPIAKLAAAQAALSKDHDETMRTA
ncbi:MAG: pyruvate, phosphate dikinase [Solibacterales bacterium]|nr:pyruvate, phosphate dikinase [Bryobacterales bacterium]|tara:strand:- start:35033 stop:37711 length:2679 start_codon:yes stop_codon:yes gene_type:complete